MSDNLIKPKSWSDLRDGMYPLVVIIYMVSICLVLEDFLLCLRVSSVSESLL